MKSVAPCFSASVKAALGLLPSPGGKRFATVFEHGSLAVEIYAPHGTDPQQPHTRDEIYFVASGTGEYVCGEVRIKFGSGDSYLPRRVSYIASRSLRTTWRCGLSSTARKVVKNRRIIMPHLESTAPCFAVSDVGQTMRWYEEQLGFKSYPFPANEPYAFAILQRDDIEIMLQRIENYQKPDVYKLRSVGVWDAYIRMRGVKELYNELREKVEILRPLQKQPYGDWEFEVKDPNGYVLVFSELIRGD